MGLWYFHGEGEWSRHRGKVRWSQQVPFQPKWSWDLVTAGVAEIYICTALLGHKLFLKWYRELSLLPFSKLRWKRTVWRANDIPTTNHRLLCIAHRELAAAMAVSGQGWQGWGSALHLRALKLWRGWLLCCWDRVVVFLWQDCLCWPLCLHWSPWLLSPLPALAPTDQIVRSVGSYRELLALESNCWWALIKMFSPLSTICCFVTNS